MAFWGKKKDDKVSTGGNLTPPTVGNDQNTDPDLLLLQMTETVKTNKNKLASNANTVVQPKKSESVFFDKLPKNPFKGV